MGKPAPILFYSTFLLIGSFGDYNFWGKLTFPFAHWFSKLNLPRIFQEAPREVRDDSGVDRADVPRVPHVPPRHPGLRGHPPEPQHRRASRILPRTGQVGIY